MTTHHEHEEHDMAQQHEIEAWLGGNWSPEDTAQLVEKILATGSDDEAEWVKVTMDHDEVPADEQHEVVLQAASADYDRAGEVLDGKREALYAALRSSVAAGMTMYRAAQVSGLSQPMVARIVKG